MPVRFVSLNPCLDAILIEVADPRQILALSHYSQNPRATSIPIARARRYKVTGGTVEEIAALGPSHVLAGAFLPPATRNALEKMGFQSELFEIAHDVEQSFAQIRRIAALSGYPERGEALIARITAVLEQEEPVRSALRTAARTASQAPAPTASRAALSKAPPMSAILWQEGGIVAGRDTLISELMAHAGLTHHAAHMGLEQADFLSLEALLANPPDIVLLAGRTRAQHHRVLEQLHGVHIARFDPALLYCAGPSIAPALERLRAIAQAKAAA